MFTGLIQEIGRIKQSRRIREGLRLIVESKELRPKLKIDDSVAINGVCQTVVALEEDCFHVETVHTTLAKTTLGLLKKGEEVNLETALTLSTPLGGHIVQGHVGSVGVIVALNPIGNNINIGIKIDSETQYYVVKEGSITLEGIGLTVADLKADIAWVTVIPHTFKNTTLRNKKLGDKINIEVDILAKYVEKLLSKAIPSKIRV